MWNRHHVVNEWTLVGLLRLAYYRSQDKGLINSTGMQKSHTLHIRVLKIIIQINNLGVEEFKAVGTY